MRPRPWPPAVKSDQSAAAGGDETPLVEREVEHDGENWSRSSRLGVARSRWGVIVHPESWANIRMLWPPELSDADFKGSLTMVAEMGAPAYRSR